MKILYICTHNRCRSILSEAITNHLSNGKITARSAGSAPSGQVHPLSLVYLEEAGVPTTGLRSQSWHEFEDFAPDLVITVCDSAAQEPCPLWFGTSMQLHWNLQDPSKIEGSEEQKAQAFRHCIEQIQQRVNTLLRLMESKTDIQELCQSLQSHGAMLK